MDKLIEQQGIVAYIETEFPLTVFKSWDVVLGFFSEVKSKTDKDSQEMYDKLPSVVMVYRGVLAKDGVKAENRRIVDDRLQGSRDVRLTI